MRSVAHTTSVPLDAAGFLFPDRSPVMGSGIADSGCENPVNMPFLCRELNAEPDVLGKLSQTFPDLNGCKLSPSRTVVHETVHNEQKSALAGWLLATTTTEAIDSGAVPSVTLYATGYGNTPMAQRLVSALGILATGSEHLTVRQAMILVSLTDAENGARTALAQCRLFGLSQSTVSRAVAALEQAGLVTRTPSERDRRETLLSVTRAGHRLVSLALRHLDP